MGACTGGIEAVETGAGGASGAEATLGVGAAAGAALKAKGLENGLGSGALDCEKRSESAEQPASQTPISPVKATRIAPRCTTNAANSLIGPTRSYATQLARSLVRTS
jgi:hypothetical protein